jgi:hypothetical protein
VGRSREVQHAITQTKQALASKTAKVAVATAVDVLAVSIPAVGTLVTAYRLSKVIYQISMAASDNYKKTRDPSKALAAGAKQALKIGISEATSQTIGTTVDTGWSAIKSIGGISTNEFEDRILTAATKSTIEEVLTSV